MDACEKCYKDAVNRIVRRSLIVFLLLVALPFKGWAATGMMACGPQHHRVAESGHHAGSGSRGMEQHAAGSQHEHADGARHDSYDAQHRHTVDSAVTEAGPEDRSSNMIEVTVADPHTSKVELKCGTCAPCCAGAAISGVHSQLPAVDPINAIDFPAFLSVHPSVPLGRLDRPPRSRLG